MNFRLSVAPRQSTKVAVLNRFFAKMIDILLVVLLGLVLRPFGPLLGFAYSLLADSWCFGPFRGQSVGKKLMKLQTVNVKTGKPASLRDSFLRNTPVGVATFFAIIPLWGWLILVILGVPLMMMELYLMVTQETGHRLGDVMGDTEVTEMKPSREKLATSL